MRKQSANKTVGQLVSEYVVLAYSTGDFLIDCYNDPVAGMMSNAEAEERNRLLAMLEEKHAEIYTRLSKSPVDFIEDMR